MKTINQLGAKLQHCGVLSQPLESLTETPSEVIRSVFWEQQSSKYAYSVCLSLSSTAVPGGFHWRAANLHEG